MKFAFLGTGYISDSYLATHHLHSDLRFVGAYDRVEDRVSRFTKKFHLKAYPSLQALLEDREVDAVINLTNPREHYETTRVCLEAGKHVYSEKPISMKASDASALASLAKEQKVMLATAPCSVLSPAAQTLWKALKSDKIGTVRMVYANFDDGMIAPHQKPWEWRNSLGVPWPAKDEFEVGCTYEHAGYFLSWLCSFFGTVKTVHSFAATVIENKGITVGEMAPDFTSGCLEFHNGVIARTTCGLVAPHDKSLTIVGDRGVLFVENLRDDLGTVWYIPHSLLGNKARLRNGLGRLRHRLEPYLPQKLLAKLNYDGREKMPPAFPKEPLAWGGDKRVDFLRGPQELHNAVHQNRALRLPAELGVHMIEIIEALQYPKAGGALMSSSLPKLEPLWSSN
jgi:predicted dehydrogenase